MNYELAKELKEAGFPQSQSMAARYSWQLGDKQFQVGLDNFPPAEQVAYLPTLEELVQATKECCAGFVLENTFLQPTAFRKTPWAAEGHNETTKGWIKERSRGVTPMEAVARLWLALNKKAD